MRVMTKDAAFDFDTAQSSIDKSADKLRTPEKGEITVVLP